DVMTIRLGFLLSMFALASGACSADDAPKPTPLLSGRIVSKPTPHLSGRIPSLRRAGGTTNGWHPRVVAITSCTEVSTGDATCDSCVQASCCNEVLSCFNNSECLAFADCSSSCSDQSCVEACGQQHAMGVNDADTLFECLSQSCIAACTGAGAGGGACRV